MPKKETEWMKRVKKLLNEEQLEKYKEFLKQGKIIAEKYLIHMTGYKPRRKRSPKETKKTKGSGNKKNGKLPLISLNEEKILKVLVSNEHGLKASIIKHISGLPQRTNYNNLKSLEKKGYLIHIRPIWKLCQSIGDHRELAKLLKRNKFELHNLSFSLRLIRTPDWWEKRHNRLMKFSELNPEPLNTLKNVEGTQLTIDNYYLQVFRNSILIISKKRYYGTDPYQVFIDGLMDALAVINYLEEKTNFKFFYDGVPQLTVRSGHENRLRHALSKICKKTKKGFKVTINGEERAVVDFSDPIGFETTNKNYNVEDAQVAEKYHIDMLANNPPTLSELGEAMKQQIRINEGIQQNQVVFDKNMASHTQAIQDISSGVTELRDSVKEFTKAIDQIKIPKKHRKVYKKKKYGLTEEEMDILRKG